MSVLETIAANPNTRFKLKIQGGAYLRPIQFEVAGNRLRAYFDYDEDLLDVIKTQFEGRRWQPELVCWDFPITQRNIFRLEALQGKYGENPYARYDRLETHSVRDAIKSFLASESKYAEVNPYEHQFDLINQLLVVNWAVWAADMGLGKSLAAIIAMEMIAKRFKLSPESIYWVGPRSALIAAKLEFLNWRCSLYDPNRSLNTVEFFTYQGITERVKSWPVGKIAPRILILDEASKVKNPAAKMSIACKHLADSMRTDHNNECYIALLTGTPAPKDPSDWWSLCEIACPGFIKEGSKKAFLEKLAILEKRETVPGAGSYNAILGWRDSENKCSKCNLPPEHIVHHASLEARMTGSKHHEYIKCTNEVAKISTRLKGLVKVKLKKDCLDLPEKRYEIKEVKPTRALLNAAKMIASSCSRSIEALILTRQLSDGFQYVDEGTGVFNDCLCCKGPHPGKIYEYINPDDVNYVFTEEEYSKQAMSIYDDGKQEWVSTKIERQIIDHAECKGTGKIEVIKRMTKEVECGKDDVLIDELEFNEENGRINIYGGFQGSVDRIVRVCQQKKWSVIRADGRGWKGYDTTGAPIEGDTQRLMSLYMRNQYLQKSDDEPLMAFIGQPGAAGMGLNLAVAYTTFFFSNDFNGESRWQAEDRAYRIGMDMVRGGRILDCFHLPTDRLVYENLQKKRNLQTLSMTGIMKVLQAA